MKKIFRILANKISVWAGSPWVFLCAVMVVVLWALSGPYFEYSDTWQLIINTGTTIITFLMVFLIQNTQNRDGKAMQLKLDELIRSSKPARDDFLDLENLTDEELADLDAQFKELREKAYKNNPPASIHKLHSKITDAKEKRLLKITWFDNLKPKQ